MDIDGPELDPAAPVAPRPVEPILRRLGTVAGLVAGAAAIGSGMLVAGAIDTVSPIDAVGSEFIDHVPGWLKELAISMFGTADKAALRIGIFVVIALIAAALGRRSIRQRLVGVAGIAAFGVIGL